MPGKGYSSVPPASFITESERLARVFEERGAAIAGWEIAQRPGRRIYAEKDPRGYAEFLERLQGHSARGAAAAIRGVLIGRKTIFEMEAELRGIVVPTLVMVGDRDRGAVDSSLFLQRTMRHASVVMFPFTGHTPNLEEPLLFNLHVGEFLAAARPPS